MAELPDVRVGQVWADNDWRSRGRLVRVIGVPTLDVPNPRELPILVETIQSPHPHAIGKQTSVRLRRFRPNSTGYRLVSEVPDVS